MARPADAARDAKGQTMKIAMTLSLVLAAGLAGCAGTGARRTLVRTEPVCQDVTVPIYFEPNQSGLTRDGRRVITHLGLQ